MHKFVSYNHQIIPFSEFNLTGISSAILYGRGVFTTLTINGAKPFLWDKHWRRLVNHASRISVDLSKFKNEVLRESLLSLIEQNHVIDARARITFFDSSVPENWHAIRKPETSLLIQTAESRKIADGLVLTVSPFPINSKSPLANIKSCNYLENILALEDAKRRGFDEAIRLNERGEISSACMANVFWIVKEKLFTPHLKTGCLAGTTRELVAEIAKEINFDYSERNADLEEILSADEVFLTSSGLSIAQVLRIENVKFDYKQTDLFYRKLNDLKHH